MTDIVNVMNKLSRFNRELLTSKLSTDTVRCRAMLSKYATVTEERDFFNRYNASPITIVTIDKRFLRYLNN